MRQQLIDDKELVNLYLGGDQSSFEVLLNRHKNRVYSYICQLVKDKMLAEDIFQDTFIKVVHTLNSGKYNEEGKFLPWVMRIAHNLVIDYFRRIKKMPSYESDDEDFDIFSTIKKPESSIEELLIENQMIEDIQSLIAKLPKDQKDVLFLRTYADLSFNEIAEQTKVSINTALGRMRYALINLRKLMKAKEEKELKKVF